MPKSRKKHALNDKTKSLRKYRYNKKLQNHREDAHNKTISTKAIPRAQPDINHLEQCSSIAEQSVDDRPMGVRSSPLLPEKEADNKGSGNRKGADEVKGGNGSTSPPPLLTSSEQELLELGASGPEGMAVWAACTMAHHVSVGYARPFHGDLMALLYEMATGKSSKKRANDGESQDTDGGGGVVADDGVIEN